MKLYFSEFQADYDNYHFPYQVYLLKEESDTLENIYSMGFLPSRSRKDLFYLARSIRIDLSNFDLSSENRRITRKTDYIDIKEEPVKSFDYDFSIGKLGKDFYEKRFGKGVMSANRIKWLFKDSSLTDVLVYSDGQTGQRVFGYCLVNKTSNILHYAYPFYDVSYFEKNAGMGMMLKALLLARDAGIKHVYLGTCYTESSLYKLQFKGVEYFNGFKWSNDIDTLKDLVREGAKGHSFEHLDKDEVFGQEGLKLRI